MKTDTAQGVATVGTKRSLRPFQPVIEWLRQKRIARQIDFLLIVRLYLIFAAIVAVPLIIATISRPFAYWDYIAVFYSIIPVAPQDSWSTIWPNLVLQFTSSGTRFFPSFTTFFQVLLALFGGEYWAAYLVKWMLKIAAAYLAAKLVRRAGGSKEGSLLAGSLMFFHPAPFELSLYMSDGLTALLMLLLANTVLVRRLDGVYRVDLAGLSLSRYLLALGVWLALLGMKESAVSLGAVFLVFWLVDPRRKLCIVRLLPFAATLAYFVYRLNRVAGSGIDLSFERMFFKLRAYVGFIDPISAATIPGLLLLAGMVVVALAAFRDKAARSFHSPQLLLIGLGAAYLTFISIPVKYPPWEAFRYVVPVVAVLSVLIGAGASLLFDQRRWLMTAGAFLFPCLTAGSIYTQHLAMNKQLDEFSVILNRLMDYEAQGYSTLKFSGSHEDTEPDVTIRRFLEFAGKRLYGVNVKGPVALDKRTEWTGAGVLATREPPARFLAGDFAPLTKSDILWIESVEKTHAGGFEYLTGFWRKVSRVLGDRGPQRYDVGTTSLDEPPTWFLYGFRKAAGEALVQQGQTVSAPFALLDDGSKVPLSGTADQPQVISNSGKTSFSLTIPLKLAHGGWQLLFQGKITVKKGSVYFGLGAGVPNTATYWNAKLEEGKTYDPLPLPAVIHASTGTVPTAFLYAPPGSELQVEASQLQDMRAIPLRMVRTQSRFGAFIR